MTLTEPAEVRTNGDVRDTVYRLLAEDPSRTGRQLSALLGGIPGERRCRKLKDEWNAQRPVAELPPPAPTELPGGPQSGTQAAQTALGRHPAPESREGPAPRALTTRTAPRRAAPGTSSRRRESVPPPPPEGTGGVEGAVRFVATWTVAGIALLMSYTHTWHLADAAGVAWPWLLPIAVDGLMVCGWMCHRRHPWYPVAVLAVLFGVAGAIVLNAVAVRPSLMTLPDVRLASAVAVPVSAFVAIHLALKR